MKILSLISVLLLLMYALGGAPGLLADDDDDDDNGGSAFDEPATEEEEAPVDEPKPATYSFKDYRIILKTEDGRFWKQQKQLSPEEEKANIVLKMEFKLPKSESRYDIYMQVQGVPHIMQFSYPDGSTVKSDNYKALCTKDFERDMKAYKGVKNVEKPKKVPLGKKRWKAYRYALTGDPGNTPRRRIGYYWKFKDKTYLMVIIMNTTAAKNKRILKELKSLLKSLEPKPERRR